jgi:exonuclease SbcC
MRLLKLKIKNMASLRGEHLIEFDEIQKNSFLFAITGETGAGKSTILNCLGLALYGQIYKKSINQNDVVTMGEKEGAVELILQVKGKFYLAQWKASIRKQNGELYATPRAPTRSLYVLDSGDFNSIQNYTEQSASELLNLSFDQFCKCVILNQGEFARFITSSFSDRKDILEKLYPGELIENIGKELRIEIEGLKNKKNEIDIRTTELQGNRPPDENLNDKKKALEKKVQDLQVNLLLIEKKQKILKEALNQSDLYKDYKSKKETLSQDFISQTERITVLKIKGEQLEKDLNKEKHDYDLNLPVLQEALKKEQALLGHEEALGLLQKKLHEDQKSLNEIKINLSKCEEEKKTWDEKIFAKIKEIPLPIEEFLASKHLIDPFLETFSEKEIINVELKSIEEKHALLKKNHQEVQDLIEKAQKELESIPKNVHELHLLAEKEKDSINAHLLEKEKNTLRRKELSSRVQSLSHDLEESLEKEKNLGQEVTQLSSELKSLESVLKLQELIRAQQVTVQHALHHDLDHCPVCRNDVEKSFWVKLKEELDLTDLKHLQKKSDHLNKTLIQKKHEREILISNLKGFHENHEIMKSQLAQIQLIKEEPLPSLRDVEERLLVLKKYIWRQDDILKEQTLKKEELKKLQTTIESLVLERGKIESHQRNLDKNLLTMGEVLKKIIPVINPDTIRELRQNTKEFREYEKLKNHQIKASQDVIHLLDKRNYLEKTYTTTLNELQSHQKKIDELKSVLLKILGSESSTSQISKMTASLKRISNQWDLHLKELQQQEVSLFETKKRLEISQEQIENCKNNFSKTIMELNNETHFEDSKNFELNSSREVFHSFIEKFHNEFEESKVTYQEALTALATTNAQITHWKNIKEKLKNLENELAIIQGELQVKLLLQEVLGKDELRNFVLALVEENLILQTNLELNKLCQGRYEIIHQTKSMGLTPEFYILDKFRGGGKRKINTLSGGETFMVSLAMALGLSEMTRGQAEIDSLFIDEGFGSLDEESLGDVLDMLQQIQTRGLMIGVISHIKTLTNSISVNLVLNKKSDGTSTVGVRFN